MLTFKEPEAEKVVVEKAPSDVELQVVDDAGVPEPVKSETQDAALEELRRQVEEAKADAARAREAEQAERNARLKAEQRATQEANKAHENEKTVEQAQLLSLSSALGKAQSEAESLAQQKAKVMADAAQASAAGETDKAAAAYTQIAKLDVEIGKVSARLVSIETGKTQLEETIAANKDKPRQLTEEESQEAWINNQHKANQDWVRQHKARFFGDRVFQETALKASNDAVTKHGFQVGTPEYIQYVEEAVGLRTKPGLTAKQPDVQASAPANVGSATVASPLSAASSPRPPAAPPAGGAPPQVKGNQRVLTITKAEREFCEMNEIDPIQYAKNREQMRKDGLIGIGH